MFGLRSVCSSIYLNLYRTMSYTVVLCVECCTTHHDHHVELSKLIQKAKRMHFSDGPEQPESSSAAYGTDRQRRHAQYAIKA